MSNIRLDGEELDVSRYAEMHAGRISWTLERVKKVGARSVVEVGSHPWVMSAAIIDDPEIELLSTISAEESTLWPDDFEPREETHELISRRGKSAKLKTHSFNIERRRFDIQARPDAVLACEIIEHLVRAPHVMLLNINDWLEIGGHLVITTPNGCQMMSPLTRASRTSAYRSHCYERHNYLYTLPQLIDLVELCGFSVVESGWSSPYPCSGTQKIRKMVASLPFRYLSEKFDRMLYVVAKKTGSAANLPRTPAVFATSPSWEYLDESG